MVLDPNHLHASLVVSPIKQYNKNMANDSCMEFVFPDLHGRTQDTKITVEYFPVLKF